MDLELAERRRKTVETVGTSLTAMDMRKRILTIAMGLKVDEPAKYAMISGCNSPTGFVHLRHLAELLKLVGVDYTFLSEEVCCGNSYLEHLDPRSMGAEMDEYIELSRSSQARNITRAKELGAEAIVTACPGCNTRYNSMHVDGDPPVLYYTQLLERQLSGLKLDGQIDFYEGCHRHHRAANFKIDVDMSLRLAKGIGGLEVGVLTNFCCKNTPDKIFAEARSDTIVTPTSCCFMFLSRARKSDSKKVKPLTQLLCEAAGIKPAVGWYGLE